MKAKSIFKAVLCVIVCVAVFACSNVARDNTADPDAGNYSPTSAQVNPPDGSDIDGRDPIVIIFNDPIDTESILIEGDMADCLQTWSSTTLDNDTLTLAPGADGVSIWPLGTAQTLKITGKSAYGLDIDTIELSYNIDYTVTYNATLITSSTITGHEKIIITFSDIMNQSSLDISGSIDTDWDTVKTTGAAWNTTSKTLTLTSSGLWVSGSRNIAVTCETAAGVAEKKPSASIALDYNVFHGVCVSDASGLDTNDGSVQNPLKTIPAGIAQADTLYTTAEAEVRVAGGNYTTNWRIAPDTDRIIMKKDVSLRGGYSTSNWLTADKDANVTTIVDQSTTLGTEDDPNRTVDISDTTITDVTDLSGFSITGGTGDYSAAVFITGSPTIENNIINGGGNGAGAYRYGIECFNTLDGTAPKIVNNYIEGKGGSTVSYCCGIFIRWASPEVTDNTIIGGTGDEVYGITVRMANSKPQISGNYILGGAGNINSYGVCIVSSSPEKIFNNIIHAGNSPTNSYGIYIRAYTNFSAPIIRNNIIVCGYPTLSAPASPPSLYCIYLRGVDNAIKANPIIDNNIVVTLDADASTSYASYAIYENDAFSDPSSLRNNDIFNYDSNSSYRYYYDEGTTGVDNLDSTSISLTTVTNTLDTWNNISVDALFADINGTDNNIATISDNDWHFTSSLPASVIQGGLNGAYPSENWGFTTDKDGTDRSPLNDTSTTGWSMGCYEQN